MPYTVTIYLAAPGTPILNDGTGRAGTSRYGHAWYQLNDQSGNSVSYGFGPVEHGDPWGPGRTYNDDSSNYQNVNGTIYSRTMGQKGSVSNYCLN